MVVDEIPHHGNAAWVGQVDDVEAVFSEPLGATLEVDRIADHHRADVELADQSTAIPAGFQRRHQDLVSIAPLPSGLAEGVGLAVYGWVALLHPAIVAATQQRSVGAE